MNKINNKSLENFKNLPILKLTGNFIGISAENKVKVNIEFINQTGEKIFEEKIARLNWQGNSSLVFPKKNYSLSLFEKDGVTKYNIKLFQDVPENNKYHLKANYIDPTHARNIVMARILNDLYKNPLPNRSIIDGFPIILYINGRKKGLYTLNLKQSAKLYGLDKKNPNHLMFRAEKNTHDHINTKPCAFRALSTNNTPNHPMVDWRDKLKKNTSSRDRDKLNRLIQWVMDCENNPTKFKKENSQYWNTEYLIDYYIHSYIFGMLDSLARNMNILTYDAKIWYPTFYDMDSSLGLFWNGSIFPTNKKFPDEYQTGDSLLWELVSKAYKEEIKDRYKELRKEKLSGENIKKYLEEFINEIPEEEYIEEQKNFKYTGGIKFIIKNNPIINQILHTIYPKRWYKINPERWGNKNFKLNHIKKWIDERLDFVDSQITF
ncbi:CotH kinase family protein [Candidatus Cetobacterium colombiensis]|uniref:CotH kinase family protein n=1 Tax=Candidatus Cetobacterium colombiensis TaxID=3073100 RepID=A0ABU4WBL1_9FUSO|nr:CotH kinase family protein [Candidatus Cetobacterium colombiensis]MDX8336930.1 CotH kinase family protein [Candidatus Cetobacterium colombiensis]